MSMFDMDHWRELGEIAVVSRFDLPSNIPRHPTPVEINKHPELERIFSEYKLKETRALIIDKSPWAELLASHRSIEQRENGHVVVRSPNDA